MKFYDICFTHSHSEDIRKKNLLEHEPVPTDPVEGETAITSALRSIRFINPSSGYNQIIDNSNFVIIKGCEGFPFDSVLNKNNSIEDYVTLIYDLIHKGMLHDVLLNAHTTGHYTNHLVITTSENIYELSLTLEHVSEFINISTLYKSNSIEGHYDNIIAHLINMRNSAKSQQNTMKQEELTEELKDSTSTMDKYVALLDDGLVHYFKEFIAKFNLMINDFVRTLSPEGKIEPIHNITYISTLSALYNLETVNEFGETEDIEYDNIRNIISLSK